MHYARYKQNDPKGLRSLIECFPFAAIIVNGRDAPIVAHTPLSFNQGLTKNGGVTFHLARNNPIIPYLNNGTRLTLSVNGPSVHISPSWYRIQDRRQTVPTYNYIHATLRGPVQALDMEDLLQQLGALVTANEADDGWKMQDIDPVRRKHLCDLISGFSVPIETFDMTAKLSQEKDREDRLGIIAGLRKRGTASDRLMSQILEMFDGTSDSLTEALRVGRTQLFL